MGYDLHPWVFYNSAFSPKAAVRLHLIMRCLLAIISVERSSVIIFHKKVPTVLRKYA